MLTRNKGFTAVAILALAIGIGPNVAMFSVIWATFLAPLPYPNADRLVVIRPQFKGGRIPSGLHEYQEYLAQSKSFEHIDFLSWETLRMRNSDPSEEDITGRPITAVFFSKTIGIHMLMGRDFLPEEGIPGNNDVVLINSLLWQERFHSDPDIIGKQIEIEHQPYMIVGVLPPSSNDTLGFTVPLGVAPGVEHPFPGEIIGRLKPGVTLSQAQAEISVINQRIVASRRYHEPHNASSVRVEPFRNDWLDQKIQRNLWILLGCVGFVLLIACANVANLLLARGAKRQREVAVRSALGATPRQVFVQMLIESATLSALAGVVGVALGWALMKFMIVMLPDLAIQSTENVIRMNIPVLLFAFGATLFAAILFGCAPAWHAMKVNLSETLKGSPSVMGGRKMRMQAILVVSEYGLAITLLAGAGMALHSFWNLSRVDIGIDVDHIVTAPLALPINDSANMEQANANALHLINKIQSLPGVQSVALSLGTPLHGHTSFQFSVGGHPVAVGSQPQTADLNIVTPGYFQTLGVRVVRGRFLDDGDNASGPSSVMVNEAFVRRYLQGMDPLAQRLLLSTIIPNKALGPPTKRQIVGVFHDIQNGRVGDEVQPQMLMPFAQNPLFTNLIIRTQIDPTLLEKSIRSAVITEFPGSVLWHMETMDEIFDTQVRGQRSGMILFGGFAALALFLSAMGIYGVMAFSVVQRNHEIGLRMALGAQRNDVVNLILTSGMKLALLGIGVGFVGVYVLGRLMHSTLYGVSTLDFGSFIAVTIVLFIVAVVASYVPARRSANVDPMFALRQE
jgi:putative ABC transport system permease protein